MSPSIVPAFGSATVAEVGRRPSWMAPRSERVKSLTPITPGADGERSPAASERAPANPARAKSARPSALPPSNREPIDLEALRAPKAPSFAPVVFECAECDGLRRDLGEAERCRDEAEARAAEVRRTLLVECEGELVRLAIAVAERVVGRELEIDPSLIATWAREAIDALASPGAAVVHAPSDTAPRAEGLAPIVPDATVAAGTLEVRSDGGRAVVSADARLAAVAEALGVRR